MRMSCLMAASCSILALSISTPVAAQSDDYSALMELDERSLESEITMRYEAGLAASLDNSIVSADDPRYLWALETKVQCGIALGFLESSTRDATSIRNCAMAYWRMQAPPPAARVIPPPPPPPRRPDICSDPIVGTVFFDFDSAAVTPQAAPTLDTVAQHISICGWTALTVVGHTDQAGSAQYNMGLSRERADAVTAALRSRNGSVPINTRAEGESNPRVPLPDGTRSPQNRRVEISAD